MPDTHVLDELERRLSAATGPDRVLDAELAEVLDLVPPGFSYSRKHDCLLSPDGAAASALPEFSTSDNRLYWCSRIRALREPPSK